MKKGVSLLLLLSLKLFSQGSIPKYQKIYIFDDDCEGKRQNFHYGCDIREFSLHISSEESNNPLPNFSPLVFRANNYGFNTYSIRPHFQNYPIPNIKMSNDGKPDTITSRDLDTFYSFYRSFLNSRTSSIHRVDNKTFVLELWNLYKLKNDTLAGFSPQLLHPPFISVNVLFQIGNISSLRFDPIIAGMKKLTPTPNGLPQPLPYNYELYSLLPRKSPLAVYKTNSFPFPYPKQILKDTELSSKGCPAVTVHVYLKPVLISKNQYDEVLKTQALIQGLEIFSNGRQNQASHIYWKPQFFITPEQDLILRRRSVSKAAAYILEFRRNTKGQSELNSYSPDCRYLENIKHLVAGDEAGQNGASPFGHCDLTRWGFLLLMLLVLLTLNKCLP